MWTVNSGGQASNRVSDTATPYGPTLQPTGLSSSRSGNQITWQWNLPENGRPIQRVQVRGAVDQVFESARQQVSFNGQDGQTYRLEVRAFAGGELVVVGRPGQPDDPRPPPSISNVSKGGLGSGEHAATAGSSATSVDQRCAPPASTARSCSFCSTGPSPAARARDGRNVHNGDRQPQRRHCSVDPNLARPDLTASNS